MNTAPVAGLNVSLNHAFSNNYSNVEDRICVESNAISFKNYLREIQQLFAS